MIWPALWVLNVLSLQSLLLLFRQHGHSCIIASSRLQHLNFGRAHSSSCKGALVHGAQNYAQAMCNIQANAALRDVYAADDGVCLHRDSLLSARSC